VSQARHLAVALPTFQLPGSLDLTAPFTFVPLLAPRPEDIGQLTERIARRLTGLVERHVAEEARTGALMEKTVAALREALSAAVRMPQEYGGSAA
jgi:hypothetical protein